MMLSGKTSASGPRLNVAFLWHQHQPYYRTDDAGGRIVYRLPWVRLHAVKDYYDIPAMLQSHPSIRQTFNLVPSLLMQLHDYADHRATDTVIELTLRSPQDLTPEEKDQILDTFFMANYERMIEPYDRYFQLLKKKLADYPFTDNDIRDLQVWYNLCWVGESWKKQEPFASLFRKGSGYTEEDKRILIDGHYRIIGEIIPLYRRLAIKGQIECAVSPLYHPILPLLCDSKVAEISDPQGLPLDPPFRYPQDATSQVERAIGYYHQIFGYSPKGMWPSEGSVSEEVAALIRAAGVHWIATDQEILEHSVVSDDSARHFTPYRLETPAGSLAVFFRDHGLSDAIGFQYAGMEAADAVIDFIRRLEKIREDLILRRLNPEDCVVPVILDGENCWEFYEHNGQPFLDTLYRQLSESSTLRTVTFSEFLNIRPVHTLPLCSRLHPGSWIYHNFRIWIGGHPEENTAWNRLRETREWFETQKLSGQHPEDMLQAAMEELFIAEGSDWFWWYGQDHWAHNKHWFDDLFRYHLCRVYLLLGQPPPAALQKPIMSSAEDTQAIRPAASRISPKVDGRISHFYEWRMGGVYESRRDSDTMNISDVWFRRIFFGNDAHHLYLRIDFQDEKIRFFRTDSDYRLMLDFAEPVRQSLIFPLKDGIPGVRWCMEDVFECAIPLEFFGEPCPQSVSFFAVVTENETEVIRRPSRQPLRVSLIQDEDDRYVWSV